MARDIENDRCDACDGEGVIDCPEMCYDDYEEDCLVCDGEGEVECLDCEGTGIAP